ncbi:MAG: CRISPR-associated endonuclease Cas2 [Bacillota bacterium]
MHLILIYDISDDRTRNKIAEACKDFGLQRVQWSAFFGQLNRNRREELMLRITKLLEGKEGDIRLYPICSKDIKLATQITRT